MHCFSVQIFVMQLCIPKCVSLLSEFAKQPFFLHIFIFWDKFIYAYSIFNLFIIINLVFWELTFLITLPNRWKMNLIMIRVIQTYIMLLMEFSIANLIRHMKEFVRDRPRISVTDTSEPWSWNFRDQSSRYRDQSCRSRRGHPLGNRGWSLVNLTSGFGTSATVTGRLRIFENHGYWTSAEVTTALVMVTRSLVTDIWWPQLRDVGNE